MSLKPLYYFMSKTGRLFFFFIILFYAHSAVAQDNVIDEIVAVVGGNVILQSDVENQYIQYRLQGNIQGSQSIRCEIFESLLFQKLLLNQAELDSIDITDDQVEEEIERKLRYYIRQFGSQKKFEEFYGKTIIEFKEEFKEITRDQLKVQRMQYNITQDVKITPSEVRKFFKSIPADSIPLINAEMGFSQIVKQPPVSIEEKLRIREKLNDLRQRILKGENFATLAILYSEDPGSAAKGGELGFYGRGELYPEFEAVAFSLKDNEVSEIVETEAGFHIIQLIERRGELINVRHILLQPKVSPEDLAKAKQELDEIRKRIVQDSISFEEAAVEYSDDPGKNNGGVVINEYSGTVRFEADEIDPSVFFVIDKLEPGDISEPVIMKTKEGQQAYRLLKLNLRTEPHKADLSTDYDKIQEWALEDKKMKEVQKWIKEKIQTTFINILPRYKDCEFTNNWLN